ncbi:hypothetical protein [Halobellus rufus]|uniref:hypothetical protein n=1 Tax=Halobellus rufus TaxID=1448860 RepID=UPI0006784BB8|nr:hypothetical protein [Halobellus rufus]
MVFALQLVAAIALIVGPAVMIKNARSTDLLSGGAKTQLGVLKVPMGLYTLGAVLILVDIVLVAGSENMAAHLLPLLGLGLLGLVSGALIFATYVQTIKGQATTNAVESLLNVVRSD